MAKKGVWGVISIEFEEGNRSGKRVETTEGPYIISTVGSTTIIANKTTHGSMLIERGEDSEGEGEEQV